MKLFLGGTCTSNWRNDLIPLLENDGIDYFNPIVDDWNEEAQKREYEEKNISCHACCMPGADNNRLWRKRENRDGYGRNTGEHRWKNCGGRGFQAGFC